MRYQDIHIYARPNRSTVRIRIRGSLGPEFIDGLFIKMLGKTRFIFELPGGWRERIEVHLSYVTEIDGIRVD